MNELGVVGYMDEFDKAQCQLIAAYLPVSYGDTCRIYFIMCNKSFDKTIEYIMNRSAKNGF